jgi:putative addiction module component (TIGR02574 family)
VILKGKIKRGPSQRSECMELNRKAAKVLPYVDDHFATHLSSPEALFALLAACRSPLVRHPGESRDPLQPYSSLTAIVSRTMERMTVEQIAEEALSLPSEARAQLADRLVESLDPAEDSYIRKLWSAEALRRRDEIRDGRVQAIPGEEVLARVRQAVRR